MDSDDEGDVAPANVSNAGGGNKKRFEVKKVYNCCNYNLSFTQLFSVVIVLSYAVYVKQ